MKKLMLAITACSVAAMTAGCASYADREGKIHLITEQEAAAAKCEKLDYAGSASAILINGKKRNTNQIVKKALAVPGATHISYTKGNAGYAFTKANIWKCSDPNMTTTDPATRKEALSYIGHL